MIRALQRLTQASEPNLAGLAWYTDATGSLVAVSDALAALLGRSKQELIARRLDLVVERHADEKCHVDARIPCADGTWRWLRVCAQPDPNLGTLHQAVDVTDLKRDLESARAELALQRAIIDAIPAFVVVKDAHNRFLRANPAADASLGTGCGALEGRTAEESFPPEVAARWRVQDHSVIESGESIRDVTEPLEVDGATRWYRFDKILFHHPSSATPLVLVVGADVSETKQLEQRLTAQIDDSEALVRVLRQREYEQNLILDHLPVLLLYKDIDNRVLRANRFGAELLGYHVSELEGRHLSFSLPAEATTLYRHDLDVLRSRQALMNVVESITTRRGEQRWVRLHHLPCFDANGALTRLIVVGEDISETRQLELDLRQRIASTTGLLAELERQNYEQRLIFDHIPARIVYKSTDNRVLRSNRYGAAFLGLTVAEFEGRHLSEIYGDKADEYFAQDLEAIRTRQPISTAANAIVAPDGRRLWERSEKVPIIGSDGEVSGILMMAVDITAQRAAEEELRRREQELRLLLDNTPAMIMFRDGDGTTLRANRLACDYFQRPQHEVEGYNLRELAPEFAEQWIAEERAVIASRQPLQKLNLRYRDKSGTLRWWRTDKVPFYDLDGRAIGVVVIVHDISAQKATEDALRVEQLQVQAQLDNSPAVIVLRDLDGRIIRGNRVFAGIVGLPQHALPGHNVAEFFPEQAARWLETGRLAVSERRTLHTTGVRYPGSRADGRCFRAATVPVFDTDDSAIGVLVMAIDVTDQ